MKQAAYAFRQWGISFCWSKMHFKFFLKSLTPPNSPRILLKGQTTEACLYGHFYSGEQYNFSGTEVPLCSCLSVLSASTPVNGNLFPKCLPSALLAGQAHRVGSRTWITARALRLQCFTAVRKITARGSRKPSSIQSGFLIKEQPSHGTLCRENYLCVFLAV